MSCLQAWMQLFTFSLQVYKFTFTLQCLLWKQILQKIILLLMRIRNCTFKVTGQSAKKRLTIWLCHVCALKVMFVSIKVTQFELKYAYAHISVLVSNLSHFQWYKPWLNISLISLRHCNPSPSDIMLNIVMWSQSRAVLPMRRRCGTCSCSPLLFVFGRFCSDLRKACERSLSTAANFKTASLRSSTWKSEKHSWWNRYHSTWISGVFL